MSSRDRMLLALAAGLALGRMLPPDWSVIVSLALFSWLAASLVHVTERREE